MHHYGAKSCLDKLGSKYPNAKSDRLLVNQKRGITPSTALRLARFFGVSADFWLNLQVRWDLYKTQQAEQDDLAEIQDVTHWQKMA